MKIPLFAAVLTAAAVLQAAIMPRIPVHESHYEIFFAITVFISLKYNWYEGAKSGIWCGLLNDSLSIGPFGLSVLVFSLTGFIASFFQKVVFTQHIATKLFILFIMSVFAAVFTLFLINEFSMLFKIWAVYKMNILTIASVNTVFSIPLYIILDKATPHDNVS